VPDIVIAFIEVAWTLRAKDPLESLAPFNRRWPKRLVFIASTWEWWSGES
jgi:hypothetical protein